MNNISPSVYYAVMVLIALVAVWWSGVNLFKLLADLVNGVENSLLNLLGAIVPYAVPVIPAYLMYHNTTTIMGFPPAIAATAAFVVEVLGLTSVSTTIKFYHHNQRYKKTDNKAPFGLALATYLFYIVIVILVNVILESIAGTRSPAVIAAITLFSLLSAPSAVLISIRVQFSGILEDIGKRYGKKENQNPNPQPQQPARSGPYTEKPASYYKDKMLALLEAEFKKSGKVLEPRAVTDGLKKKYSVILNHEKSKGFISTTITEWCASKGITRSKNVPERSDP